MAILYRAGDVVWAKCKVRYDCKDGDEVFLDVSSSRPEDTKLVSRRFRPGEAVSPVNPVHDLPIPGEVISVFADRVWVDFGGEPHTFVSTELLPFRSAKETGSEAEAPATATQEAANVDAMF